MPKHIRRRLFVDNQVQGRLLWFLVRSWTISLLAVAGLTTAGWIFVTPGVNGFVGPNSFMSSIFPMLVVGVVCSMLTLPFMMWRLMRESHRFAGPLLRFRRELREAADSGKLKTIHFRDGDDWQDLALAYNDLVARIHSERLADCMSPELQQQLDRACSSSYHADSEEPETAATMSTSV